MSFLQRAKEAASSAAEQARVAAEQARAKASDPATQERVRLGMVQAGGQARIAGGVMKRGFSNMIDRIDPGILADIVIKATALQEKTNGALRQKGSPYRIAEVTITATLPPQVGFSIARVGDIEEKLTGNEVDSSALVTEVLAEEAAAAHEAAANGDLQMPVEGEIGLGGETPTEGEMATPEHADADDFLP